MKSKIAIFAILSFAVLMAAGSVRAQGVPRVGGYSEISKANERALSAAVFAVKAQTEESGRKETLMSVFKAERQVVAGTNYRLCLKVTSEGKEDEADIIHYVQAIVYVDLKGVSKLTQWRDSDCGEDED